MITANRTARRCADCSGPVRPGAGPEDSDIATHEVSCPALGRRRKVREWDAAFLACHDVDHRVRGLHPSERDQLRSLGVIFSAGEEWAVLITRDDAETVFVFRGQQPFAALSCRPADPG